MKQTHNHKAETKVENYSVCTKPERSAITYAIEPRFTETQQILLKFNYGLFGEEISLYSEQPLSDDMLSRAERCESYFRTPIHKTQEKPLMPTHKACCAEAILFDLSEQDFNERIRRLHILFDRDRARCTCEDSLPAQMGSLLKYDMDNKFKLLQAIRNFGILANPTVRYNAQIAINADDVNGIHIALTRSRYGDTACTAINLLHINDQQFANFSLGPLTNQNVQQVQYIACQSFVHRAPHTSQALQKAFHERVARVRHNMTYVGHTDIQLLTHKVDSIQFQMQINAEVDTSLLGNLLNVYTAGLVSIVSYVALQRLSQTKIGYNISKRMSSLFETLKHSFAHYESYNVETHNAESQQEKDNENTCNVRRVRNILNTQHDNAQIEAVGTGTVESGEHKESNTKDSGTQNIDT